MQQRRQRTGALPGFEIRPQGFAPDTAEQFPVLIRHGGQLVVLRVLDGDGGDLAEEDHSGLVAQEGVVVAQFVHPGGDGGGGEGAFGGQAAVDEGVEDGQRQLDGTAVRTAGVEEGADRLLGQPEVVVSGEVDDGFVGDRGREERRDDLLPLPGVDGQQQVVVGVAVPVGEDAPEGVEGVGGEFLGVEEIGGGQGGGAAVFGEVAVDGDPGQPVLLA